MTRGRIHHVNKGYKMAFCNNCGNKIGDNASFCGNCGTPVSKKSDATDEAKQDTSANDAQVNETATSAVDNETMMGVMSYLSLLVLIPIFAAKGNKFIRFHANQGLILCILGILWWLLLWIIGNLPYFIIFVIMYRVVEFAGIAFILLLAILGIINVARHEETELPFIGRFRILK